MKIVQSNSEGIISLEAEPGMLITDGRIFAEKLWIRVGSESTNSWHEVPNAAESEESPWFI